MVDLPISAWLAARDEGKNPAVVALITTAKTRIQSILDRETVSHQKTLEQKIAEQGPKHQRVHPHLIGLALKDLQELNRLRTHTHPATKNTSWYSNLLTDQALVDARLNILAPLYSTVSGSSFGNLTGDALEVIVFVCLERLHKAQPRYAYQGAFDLSRPKDQHGRFYRIQPPSSVGLHTSQKQADFIQHGHDDGSLCIECKNYREWLYPHDEMIKDLIIKSYQLGLIPVLVHRRIHYTTLTNFFEPAGIIAHESYFQYYPSDRADLATQVSDKRSLGFTDVRATEEPDARTIRFFEKLLPSILPTMSSRWKKHRDALYQYATDQINLAQLYTKIGSQAGGKWVEHQASSGE